MSDPIRFSAETKRALRVMGALPGLEGPAWTRFMRETSMMSAREHEVLDQLLAEGWSGTPDELITAARGL